MEEYFTAELERRIEECEEQQHEVLEKALKESRQHHEALIQVEQKKAQEANICAEVYVFKYNAEFTRRSSQKEPSEVPGATKTPKSKENLNVFDFMERPEKNSSLASSHEAETGSEIDDITTESELLENKWGERDPYMHSMPRPGPRRWPTSDAASSNEEGSNVIMFPPRAGSNDMGHNQLGNYLSMSGFTPMFEERESRTARRQKLGSAGNVLRGTLFWQPPASTAEADLYKSLRDSGWRPTYVWTTGKYQYALSYC